MYIYRYRYIGIYISMVLPGELPVMSLLRWEQKRIIYLHTKMLSLLQWHTASYCTWTLLCRRFTLSLKLSGLFDRVGTCVVVFFLFFLMNGDDVFVFLCLFFLLSFVQPSVWIARSATGALNTLIKTLGKKKENAQHKYVDVLCMFLSPSQMWRYNCTRQLHLK